MIGAEILLGVGLVVSSGVDVHTTNRAMQRCGGCVEGNPLMRPFMGSTAKLVGVQGGLGMLTLASSHKLKQGKSKGWWVPVVVGIGVHLGASWSNSRVPKGPVVH